MSGLVAGELGEAGDFCRSGTIRVVIRSVTESRDFSVGGDCTIRQLKWTLSEHLGGSAEQLVLIHSGRVLKDTELMSDLKGQNGPVSLCMTQRPRATPAQPVSDPASERVRSELTADPDPDQNLTPTPTSPLCLVEGLDRLDLGSSDPGFPALQHETESQLLGDPERVRRVLRSSLVQNTSSSSSPQLTRLFILSNPQIQQLLQTNPEVEDMLNDTDIIKQVIELIEKPDVVDEMIQNTNRPLNNLLPEQDIQDTNQDTAASVVLQKTKAKTPQSSLQLLQNEILPAATTSSVNHPEQSVPTPALSGDSTDPLKGLVAAPRAASSSQRTITAGMQSLLEEIAASPGLMESLLSGPCVSSLLDCLGQNPDLAAQMLLSHPLFSGNAQLQQQMRQQIPLFLHQMQSPELLSVMLNPRVMEALLQIQQGLQTLAAEAPSLIPVAGLGASGAGADAAPNNQSGCRPPVATVTEQQQQQFVQQMLQALANTNNQLCHEEDECHQELEQLSSVGFRDRRANL